MSDHQTTFKDVIFLTSHINISFHSNVTKQSIFDRGKGIASGAIHYFIVLDFMARKLRDPISPQRVIVLAVELIEKR